MASDLSKHKADMLKIGGLALISPFGRIIMQPMLVIKEFNSSWFFAYLIFAFLLAVLGFIVILRSYDMLR